MLRPRYRKKGFEVKAKRLQQGNILITGCRMLMQGAVLKEGNVGCLNSNNVALIIKGVIQSVLNVPVI